jgi:hypothetical protein
VAPQRDGGTLGEIGQTTADRLLKDRRGDPLVDVERRDRGERFNSQIERVGAEQREGSRHGAVLKNCGRT